MCQYSWPQAPHCPLRLLFTRCNSFAKEEVRIGYEIGLISTAATQQLSGSVGSCFKELVANLVQSYVVRCCSGATPYVWFKYEIQIIASQFEYGISSLHNTDITTPRARSSAYQIHICSKNYYRM